MKSQRTNAFNQHLPQETNNEICTQHMKMKF